MAELPGFARFWMVARKPNHARARTEPKARYSTLADARAAARDLARQIDAPFVILETVEIIRPGDDPETGRLL